MMKNYTTILFFLMIAQGIFAQGDRYGLSLANETVSGNTLCVDIQLRFSQGGKLGSSNLVMEYNKTMLANPVYSSDNLPLDKYSTSTVTNPVDSLASFNIELLVENEGISIASSPAKTSIGKLCFDLLGGMEGAAIDFYVKNTNATVIYKDDESTKPKKGRIDIFCNNVGQACDDGDVNTEDDIFDKNCLCAGTQMNCEEITEINQEAIPARTYKSKMQIRSEGRVRSQANVAFRAAESITLSPGFFAEEGCDFIATIEDCVDNLVEETIEKNKVLPTLSSSKVLESMDLSVAPNPIVGTTTITYVLPQKEKVNLSIYTLNGQMIEMLYTGEAAKGMNIIEWQRGQTPPGMYLLRMMTANGRMLKKVVVQ